MVNDAPGQRALRAGHCSISSKAVLAPAIPLLLAGQHSAHAGQEPAGVHCQRAEQGAQKPVMEPSACTRAVRRGAAKSDPSMQSVAFGLGKMWFSQLLLSS